MLEGSPSFVCMGKPVSYIGHKVQCPKCRGSYPIVEGVMTASVFGKGVAVAGMKTSCGATLIASQFTVTVEWSRGVRSASSKVSAGGAVPAPVEFVGMLPLRVGSVGTTAQETVGQYDEQPQLSANLIDGVPYLIVTKDGRKFSGSATPQGTLPRIETYDEEEYTVYWGDIALAEIEGSR